MYLVSSVYLDIQYTLDTRYIYHYNEINCNYRTVDIQYTLDTRYICHYNEINCNYKTVDIQYCMSTVL
jgi:hypothetical protein